MAALLILSWANTALIVEYKPLVTRLLSKYIHKLKAPKETMCIVVPSTKLDLLG